MGINVQEICGDLTEAEMKGLILNHWPINNGIAEIPYSFDIRQHQRRYPELELASSAIQSQVPYHMDAWEEACDNRVTFKFVDQVPLSHDFKGIVIGVCDLLDRGANGYWKPLLGYTGSGLTFQGMICLPPKYFDDNTNNHILYNFRSITHELGHALGLDHLHENPRIKQHLMSSPQGLACSVMPYVSVISSPINQCIDAPHCYGAKFPVMPGPMDAQMCQFIYAPPISPPSEILVKKGHISEPKQLLAPNLLEQATQSCLKGVGHGMKDNFATLLSGNGNSKSAAKLKAMALYYGVIMALSTYNTYNTPGSNLGVTESINQAFIDIRLPLGVECISYFIEQLSDYCTATNHPKSAKACQLFSTGGKLMLFGGVTVKSASKSVESALGYTAGLVTGTLGYLGTRWAGSFFMNEKAMEEDKEPFASKSFG